jgi:protein TonB
MEATVPGGGVALPATSGAPGLRGDPAAPASAPAGDQPADATAVDRLPRLLGQPGSDAMRALYPEPARRDGLEGDVLLEILVSERGAVEDVRVARSAGHGFDEVARRLARQMRFEPAVRAGRPVSVWIPWTWKFRLDA